jgi:tetratricopeptide (TPR) repeat protein
MSTTDRDPNTPKAFLSYSWDDDSHKEWVKDLAVRLRNDGVETVLDRWHAVPGEELPEFMERAVRESDFVIAVCTPKYKEKMDRRGGGVGYEGRIMSAEVWTGGNSRKFIAVLRRGASDTALPSWRLGSYYIDLSGDTYSEANYQDLLSTLLGDREEAPPVVVKPRKSGRVDGSMATPSHEQTVYVEPPADEPSTVPHPSPDTASWLRIDQIGRNASDPLEKNSTHEPEVVPRSDPLPPDQPKPPRRWLRWMLRRLAVFAAILLTLFTILYFFIATNRGRLVCDKVNFWLYPDYSYLAETVADDYFALKKFEAVEHYHNEAVRLAVQDGHVYVRRADRLSDLADARVNPQLTETERLRLRKKAIADYDRAFELGESTINDHASKGRLLIEVESLGQAIDELSQVIKWTENLGPKTGEFGLIYGSNNDTWFRDYHLGNYYWLRSIAYRRNGDIAKAEDDNIKARSNKFFRGPNDF